MNQSNFGQLVREGRKGAALSQIELAKRANMDLSTVQTIERGRGRVSSLKTILKIMGLELRGRQLVAGPVGPALVQARKRRKISRRRLAMALGVSRNTLAAVEQDGGLVSTLEAYAGAVGAGLYLASPEAPRPFSVHAGNSTGNNQWETPLGLAKAISEAVGGFDLDPCAATRDRRKARIKARVLLTAADDGLAVPWRGKVFVNPPYSRHLSQWVQKCLLASRSGCLVVGLIPARPDTSYWHDFIGGRADVLMLRGRLKFGDGGNSAPFPSAVVVWGADPEVIQRIRAAVPGAWHIPRHTPSGQLATA